MDKYLCTDHIDDSHIRGFIKKWSSPGKCTYCGKRKKVALLKDVLPFIEKGIYTHYDQPENEGMYYDKEESEYWGAATYSTEEMLFAEAGLNVNSAALETDLINSFGDDNLWCDSDPYGDRENVVLNYDWNEFKYVVKHRSRYVFLGSNQFKTSLNNNSVDLILNQIGRLILDLDLFRWIDKDTVLYRCRQHPESEHLENSSDFTSPPVDKAIYANRMSPAGISMFYCSFYEDVSYAETLDLKSPVKSIMTTSVFLNKERLYLLDLGALPEIPSIFDEKKSKYYDSILFLRDFVADLSAKVERDNREHIEYVPTQIVTEYFRYTFEEGTHIAIDGILYPSSKIEGKSACVLFYDMEECKDSLVFDTKKLKRTVIKEFLVI